MKTSIRTIGVALLVLSAFVGFAAADVLSHQTRDQHGIPRGRLTRLWAAPS